MYPSCENARSAPGTRDDVAGEPNRAPEGYVVASSTEPPGASTAG